jgi:precorrin-6A/cobalt-precorrin-6A reductase
VTKLLILGGTTEASALAAWLVDRPEFNALLSFAGTTRTPRPPPIPYRVGGFGGPQGLANFLRNGGYQVMIDATHPFAAQMKRNAAEAARLAGIDLLAIHRPAWHAVPGDKWHHVPDMAHAAQALGATPRRILLTIGQKDLAAFKAAPWHHYIVRSVDPPDTDSLPPHAEIIAARGPFLLADELALLRGSHVSALVTKNSGGTATMAKLEAARICGVEVVMIDRPEPQIGVATVQDPAQAKAWLRAHAGTDRGL